MIKIKLIITMLSDVDSIIICTGNKGGSLIVM